jgi:hypothetical protein
VKLTDRVPYRIAWLASLLVVGALYYWIIGIGAVSERFAWNSGLDTYYGLPGPTVAKGSYAVNGYYDLLARAFVSGKLYMPVLPEPALLALPHPYEEAENGPYRLLDTVLYKQHYYLYHGPVPVIVLFVPWYLLTAHDMPENFAAFLFAAGGYVFLSLLFLQLLTYLSVRVPIVVFILCLLAIGMAQSVPFLLHRAKLYEVAIACGFCCVSAGFYFLFRSLTASSKNALWSGLSGLFFGLAIGCRPHLGLAAVCALALLMLLRFARREVFALALPVIACGLGIAAYNYARFGNPLEFGLSYQLAAASYQNIRLSIPNVAPGLYYWLLCPPNLVPEFPFVRLAFRYPFDAVDLLPMRYFLEPTGGILALCPLVFIAILAPFCGKLFSNRRTFALITAILVFTAGCILFVSATGLTSQRYEVDFQPYLVFVACISACLILKELRTSIRMMAIALLVILVLYSVAANVALAVQGPYDQFVQASPGTYARLARWFSPIERYRPQEDPAIRVQAAFDFPRQCVAGMEPLISAGEFGSRYLLSAACLDNSRMRLVSETSYRSPDWIWVDVPYAPGRNYAAIQFNPQDRTMTVTWNGNVALRHHLRFLVTAPSQIRLGWDPTLGNKTSFPGRIVPGTVSVEPP